MAREMATEIKTCTHGAYLCVLCGQGREPKIQTTFRIVKMGRVPRFIGLAWNYEASVMVTTPDLSSYGAARAELDARLREVGAETRWFDGAYEIKPGSRDMLEMPTGPENFEVTS